MVDEDSARRAIEILNVGIAIQELTSSEDVEGLDILHLTKEKGDKTMDIVMMRMRDNIGISVEGREFIWDLTTLKSK